MPGGGESWTVVDQEGEVLPPAETYLAHLTALDRSPNTVRAYATSLKLWFEFLGLAAVDWDHAGQDEVSRFVAWLRAPAANVVVLEGGAGRRAPSSVNRHLAALFSFYDHHARAGVALADSLVSWRRSGRGGYKPFLHHVTAGRPVPARPVRLRVRRLIPRTLSPDQMATIIGACERRRDQFLLSLLAETGMRIGQALGLRHADFVSRDRQLRIVPRSDNANGARAKTADVTVVPITASLVRLYTEYMFEEYGELDSDYVFVNLWSAPLGAPLRYQAVHQLVGRLRARTGIDFTLHMLRHTHATELLRHGVSVDVVSRLLTHRLSTTTSQTYGHLDVEDLRAELVRVGAWQETKG
ncbi:MAG: tyrosine-type recombinase/integrase [Pseudonocardiaceae bacterium]